MGTNYYAVLKKPSVWNRTIHLGKSSAGWRFLFHETDEIRTFPQFKQWLADNVGETKDYVLMDEYEEEVNVDDLIAKIESKQENNNPDNFTNCRNIDGYRFCSQEFS